MALSDTLLARLIETVKENDLGGRFLMLGRQRWKGSRKGRSAQLLADTMEKYLPGLTEGDLNPPGTEFTEPFFERLGFDSVDSLDLSDFEGATVIQDLSGPLDPALEGAFDVIYDGGTCEHVFDLPQAYRNVDAMLKPGGVLIGHSPCNNWINHSFYQICPEMVYGFWQTTMGYELLHLTLQPLLPQFANRVVETTDPNQTGNRPKLKARLPNNSPIILNYAVRKPTVAQPAQAGVHQEKYKKMWAR